ncbi:2Fe-2S iron-sulfur cluster-binding protein [Photobacterium galatheae]|uniref:Ferredoxin n=1 Tax=Photobacterium galatheae TaxID=1654360 RepID=A0A066RYC4_9GAMM|nr:2Fe-2S iron-sulfur cluster-binding protein [Photobacterium galatheae]KDM92393.1 ferredoxin [Photobacterium galatheae]MCM0150902.1 2Fe-2S iron-sulfur cluster binding domain-containing protein [Photobacterium galatheae]
MTTYRIRLLPQDVDFDAGEDETLLSAARRAGFILPHRCLIGACASCLCRKLSGEVNYQLAPMLTEREQAAGWILPCQAKPRSDLVLTLE